MKLALEQYRYVMSQRYSGDTVFVTWNDIGETAYNAVRLGCDWLRMSNDEFYDMYGFNFNPHSIPGLVGRCRDIVNKNANLSYVRVCK